MNLPRWTILLALLAGAGCSGGSVNGQPDSGNHDDAGVADGSGDPGLPEDAGDTGGDAGTDAGGTDDAGDSDAGLDGGNQEDAGDPGGDPGPIEVTPYKVTALTMSADQEDLWIGTASGAARVHMATMEHTLFSTANSDIPSNEIVGLLADRQGNIWFGFGYASCPGTSNGFCGLSHYSPDSNTWETYTVDGHGLLDDRVFGIQQAPDDTVWAGTYQGAIHNTVTGSWGVYFDWHDCSIPGTHCSEIWSYTVAGFAFPVDGSMWLAIDLMPVGISPKPGGVARRNLDQTTDTWKIDHGLPSNQATCIAQVGMQIWIGSPDGAAYYLPQTESFQETTSRIVHDIAQGPDGLPWLATEQGAMRRLQDDSWEIFTMKDGLPSDRVTALAPWGELICLGTENGVGCLNPEDGGWIYVH